MGKQDALTLQKLRKKIDQLDEQIIRALNERAATVEEVWKWKQKNQHPFIDPGREEAIFAKIRAMAEEPLSPGSAQKIFQCILDELRPNLQKAQKLG
jgi:chorismate mutase